MFEWATYSPGGDQVNQMQAEIERNTKMLTDLESETAASRNQLSSLDSQKMKLVQEGISVRPTFPNCYTFLNFRL